MLALVEEERVEVIAQLVEHLDRTLPNGKGTSSTVSGAAPSSGMVTTHAALGTLRPQTYKYEGAKFVLEHPEGSKTSTVAKAIGQGVNAANGTLNALAEAGIIEKRDGFWFPKTAAQPVQPSAPVRETHRTRISQAITEAGRDLGAGAIYQGCLKFKPDTSRASIDGEIHRMIEDEFLEPIADAQSRGNLYRLTAKGRAAMKP